jgi:hypothetical protein
MFFPYDTWKTRKLMRLTTQRDTNRYIAHVRDKSGASRFCNIFLEIEGKICKDIIAAILAGIQQVWVGKF